MKLNFGQGRKNGHDTAAAGAEATIDIKERSCTALSLKMSVSVVSCIRTYKVILYLERYFKRVSGVADMQMLTAPRSLAPSLGSTAITYSN